MGSPSARAAPWPVQAGDGRGSAPPPEAPPGSATVKGDRSKPGACPASGTRAHVDRVILVRDGYLVARRHRDGLPSRGRIDDAVLLGDQVVETLGAHQVVVEVLPRLENRAGIAVVGDDNDGLAPSTARPAASSISSTLLSPRSCHAGFSAAGLTANSQMAMALRYFSPSVVGCVRMRCPFRSRQARMSAR